MLFRCAQDDFEPLEPTFFFVRRNENAGKGREWEGKGSRGEKVAQ